MPNSTAKRKMYEKLTKKKKKTLIDWNMNYLL